MIKPEMEHYTKKRAAIAVGVVVLSVALIVIFQAVKEKEPIKVGLACTLTGMSSTFGKHQRNGVILAVTQVNEAGGINGRHVELITRDDKGDPETALRVDRELIDKGVSAIIGHHLSTLSVKVAPLMNEKNVLMMPAAITTELTGLDDNIIRIVVPIDIKAPIVAAAARNRLQLRKMAVAYDRSNPNYSEPYHHHFKKEFEKLGGVISVAIPFDPREKFSATDIAGDIVKSEAEGLFLATNSIRGALICQHLRKSGSAIKIIDAGWGFPDPDFIENGGPAVDGVVSVFDFDGESSHGNFVKFSHEFELRFANKVSLGSQLGYETARVLLYALSKTTDPGKLKETILKKKVFEGVDGPIIIDEYGDPLRTQYIQEIRNGKIQTLEKIQPSLKGG